MNTRSKIDRLRRAAAKLWTRLGGASSKTTIAPPKSPEPDKPIAPARSIAREKSPALGSVGQTNGRTDRPPSVDARTPKPAIGLLPEVADFGSNPGGLKMRVFVPPNPSRMRPLVVVLHGCGQTVEGYDAASGWSRIADQHDFILLYPEQQESNNRQRCFSWFETQDTRRGTGEVESIREMVSAAVATFGADPKHVYICGLSAGGAMTGAMLATYPELFRGGAIIAGLPFGTASNASEAYESMSTGKIKEAKAWGDFVRTASTHRGPWPSVAIWHGMEDDIVKPINAGELIKQWINVHDIGAAVPSETHIGRAVRRAWVDEKKRPQVIEYSVFGLGHGVPVDDVEPPAPFFLPAGISAAKRIADDWGLTRRSRPRTMRAIFGIEPRPTEPLEEPAPAGLRAPHPG